MTPWIKHNVDEFSEVRDMSTDVGLINVHKIVEITSTDSLGAPIPANLKALILTGDDPHHPRGSRKAKYPSRSEATFAAMTGLARLNIPAEKIAGICINPDYEISERFLERRNPQQQAIKEALRAILAVTNHWRDVFKNGKPKPTFRNAFTAIVRLGIVCSFDTFRNRLVVGQVPLQSYVGELSDKAVTIIRKVILDSFDFDPFTQNVRDGLETLALENTIHPIKRYFGTLEWDRNPRIRAFFSKYMEAENTELNQAIAFIMFVAAVRRILKPGCKFDTMIVLEGIQGTGKSTVLKILASEEFFSDQDIIAVDNKSQMELLEGVWIYELCELSGMRHTDISKLKSFLSRQEDRGRPAYGRYKEVIKRQSIFVGTTNDQTYLKDKTGNRRYLPVKTGVIDLAGVARDRDQLWAEALYWEAKDASIVLPEELWAAAAREQEAREYHDPWMDLLSDESGTTIGEQDRVFTKTLMGKLEIPAAQQQHYQLTRLGECMRKIGWQGPKRMRIGDESLMGYWRQSKTEGGSVDAIPF